MEGYVIFLNLNELFLILEFKKNLALILAQSGAPFFGFVGFEVNHTTFLTSIDLINLHSSTFYKDICDLSRVLYVVKFVTMNKLLFLKRTYF